MSTLVISDNAFSHKAMRVLLFMMRNADERLVSIPAKEIGNDVFKETPSETRRRVIAQACLRELYTSGYISRTGERHGYGGHYEYSINNKAFEYMKKYTDKITKTVKGGK